MSMQLILLLPIALVLASCSSCSNPAKETADQTADQTEDLKPRCIENWPVDPKATPSPSLPIDNAGQVLWTKVVPGGFFQGPLAMAGDRMAYLSGNTLVILNAEGDLVNVFQDPKAFTSAGHPVADIEGNFYFGAANVISVDRHGEPRWRFSLGPDILGTETTYTSKLRLSPDEVLYFGATDGFLYAVNAADGTLVWKRQVGVSTGHGPWGFSLGIGDSLFVAVLGQFQAATGDQSAPPAFGGQDYYVLKASYSSLMGIAHGVNWEVTNWYKTLAFNKCGELQWSFPTDNELFTDLVGFEDSIVARYANNAYVYSSSGEPLMGPAALDRNHFATVIGADGTLYYTYCADLTNPGLSEMSVLAYSPQLEPLWSVDLGISCTFEAPLLATDGRLYVLRTKDGEEPGATSVELTAIQTASPGLANTAYPTFDANNRRTGWIGGPQ